MLEPETWVGNWPWVLTCWVTSSEDPPSSLCLSYFVNGGAHDVPGSMKGPTELSGCGRDYMPWTLQRGVQAPGTRGPHRTFPSSGDAPLGRTAHCSRVPRACLAGGHRLCFHGSPVSEQQLQQETSHLPQKNSDAHSWPGHTGTSGRVGPCRSAATTPPPPEATSREGRLFREPPPCPALRSGSSQSLAGRERPLSLSLRLSLPLRLTEWPGKSLPPSLGHHLRGITSLLALSLAG